MKQKNMTSLLWHLILCTLAGCHHSPPPSNCAVSPADYSQERVQQRGSVFLKTAKAYQRVHPTLSVANGLEDRADLKDGSQVTYTEGGCEHFRFLFSLQDKRLQKMDDAKAQAFVRVKLQSLSLRDPQRLESLLGRMPKIGKDSVGQARESLADAHLSWECGEATCFLERLTTDQMTLIYDQPL